jgi:NAD(P)H-quinone oxidoreductase subunit 6
VSTALVCTGLFALLSTMVLTTPWSLSSATSAGDNATMIIGQHFFSDFLLPFELASVLLLMALVGAIVLARREFLPDQVVLPDQADRPVLTLPERPRELVSIAPGSPERTITTDPDDRNA